MERIGTRISRTSASGERHRRRMWRAMPEFAGWRRTVVRAYVSAAQPIPAAFRRFAVVTNGRSDSELLVRALDSHPDIRCDSEVLDHGPDSARLFLRGRVAAAARDGALAYGFTLTADQLTHPVLIRQPRLLVDDLASAGTHFVRLRSTDMIRQALLHARARALRTWHGGNMEGTEELCPSDVVHALVWLEQHEELLDAALDGHPVVDLVCERDISTPDARAATANELFDRLGLRGHDPSVRLPRSSCATTQMVINWDEIESVIAGTRFAHHLDAVGRSPNDRPMLYDTAAKVAG